MDPLLKRLSDHQVEFVLVGGFAAMSHGSPVVTQDVDVCAPLTLPNLTRIVESLRDLQPMSRFRPDRLPLFDDPARLVGFRNLNLVTEWGVLDILGDLPGVGSFGDLAGRTIATNFGEFVCQVLDLETLIASKTAAGRPKDLVNVRHLEAIQRMKREQPGLFDPPPKSPCGEADPT